MLKGFRGHLPNVDPTAWVSETAVLIGQVTVGAYSGVWPGAVIRGDFAHLQVGAHTVIEDNCVVHSGTDLVIGEHVIVGHGAILHCDRIGDRTLIGNGATLLDGAEVGSYCIIGAGAVVSPGDQIPDGSLVFGVPGKVVGPVKDRQRERLDRGNASYIEMFEEYRRNGI